MAIQNLQCTREGDTIAVVWTWDTGQERARITVTRLLDGKEDAYKEVDQNLYQQAIHGPRHGPVLKASPVPLRITVQDDDNEESFDLIDKHYTVEWRLKKLNIYQKKGLFRQTLDRTDVWLQILFPYESQVPGDLFYYTLTVPGAQPRDGDPVGYLPSLQPGGNEYGVVALDGRTIQLCCNPDRQEVSRLFQLKKISDIEQ